MDILFCDKFFGFRRAVFFFLIRFWILGVPVVIKCIMKIVSLCRHLMSWPLLYLKIVLFLNQPSVKAVALTHTFQLSCRYEVRGLGRFSCCVVSGKFFGPRELLMACKQSCLRGLASLQQTETTCDDKNKLRSNLVSLQRLLLIYSLCK